MKGIQPTLYFVKGHKHGFQRQNLLIIPPPRPPPASIAPAPAPQPQRAQQPDEYEVEGLDERRKHQGRVQQRHMS